MDLIQILETSITAVFCLAAVYLSFIDIKSKRIPNNILVPTAIYIFLAITLIQVRKEELGWLIINFGIPGLVFAAFLAIYAIYPKGLGMGDLKAILLIGLLLCRENPALYFYSVGASFILGSTFVLLSRLFGKKSSEFPFGPFLFLPAAALALLQQLI